MKIFLVVKKALLGAALCTKGKSLQINHAGDVFNSSAIFSLEGCGPICLLRCWAPVICSFQKSNSLKMLAIEREIFEISII